MIYTCNTWKSKLQSGWFRKGSCDCCPCTCSFNGLNYRWRLVTKQKAWWLKPSAMAANQQSWRRAVHIEGSWTHRNFRNQDLSEQKILTDFP